MSHYPARTFAALLFGAAALVAAGCGGEKNVSTPPTELTVTPNAGPTTSTTLKVSSGSGVVGTAVTVIETEYRLALSTSTFTAGKYTFTAENKGTIVHALAVTGPGVAASTPTLNPGQSANLTVTLQAGSYDVFCPIPGHKALGMDQQITVTG